MVLEEGHGRHTEERLLQRPGAGGRTEVRLDERRTLLLPGRDRDARFAPTRTMRQAEVLQQLELGGITMMRNNWPGEYHAGGALHWQISSCR